MTAYQFEFRTLAGEALPLSRYEGKVLLVVNTASACGFTSQYRDLQGLWERYKHQGLVVIGVPSNDFGGQEPGDEQEIARFCEVNYSVTFPMTAKERVLGEDAHPFYQWIEELAGEAGRPRWNFHKYLIGADGSLLNVFPSKVAPMEHALIAELEAALEQA